MCTTHIHICRFICAVDFERIHEKFHTSADLCAKKGFERIHERFYLSADLFAKRGFEKIHERSLLDFKKLTFIDRYIN